MTQQAAPLRKVTETSESRSSAMASMMVKRSVSKSGSTTWASGSPKRQLYSMTLGPASVSMSPKYRQPLKGRPSTFMAAIVGKKISFMHCAAIVSV